MQARSLEGLGGRTKLLPYLENQSTITLRERQSRRPNHADELQQPAIGRSLTAKVTANGSGRPTPNRGSVQTNSSRTTTSRPFTYWATTNSSQRKVTPPPQSKSLTSMRSVWLCWRPSTVTSSCSTLRRSIVEPAHTPSTRTWWMSLIKVSETIPDGVSVALMTWRPSKQIVVPSGVSSHPRTSTTSAPWLLCAAAPIGRGGGNRASRRR